MKQTIKVAIVGVGNCAKSLIEGVDYYTKNQIDNEGLTRRDIGGYLPSNIEFVCGFDVDTRKVGKPLHEAIYEKPNCAVDIISKDDITPNTGMVYEGALLDGVADHMRTPDINNAEKFYAPTSTTTQLKDIVTILNDHDVDILINYLPVGSQEATELYANACIESSVAFMNCIPVFIASDKKWEQKFIDAGLPLIGDDMKSQFGASIVSQLLQELAFARGHKVKCHIQRNVQISIIWKMQRD